MKTPEFLSEHLTFLYIADGESFHKHSSEHLSLQRMSAWNRPKATHIYTVSITYFVLKFCGRFFNTHSITYMTCTKIFTYILEQVYRMVWDAAEFIYGFIDARKK
jgi:hypothetical protein